ncbi:hypothetical protein BU15DRAFT_46348 [Melanogaster broomeanus]|nr:hypothetical protein BU15DRAFT_46348 [Melanogaster broomeanus]
MAGAFSGHLLESFNRPFGPFPSGQPCTPNIITSGAMTFDSRMHGYGTPSTPTPLFGGPFGNTMVSEDSATRIATLQAKLNKKLGPEFISQRPGPGGGPKLIYAEGWKIINLANEVFGFNGWSSSIVSITTDFVDYIEESRRYNVGVSAMLRVTLRDGTHHEDVGYGMLENSKSKAAALDKCKKEAITDALKRTLRNFGNLLGNCLYDKAYAQEVAKMKIPPAKFDKNDLYRRPEFQETKPDVSTTPPPAPALRAVSGPTIKHEEKPHIKTELPTPQSETPIAYVPRHLRQEVAAAQQTHPTPTHIDSAQAPTSKSRTTDVSSNRELQSISAQKPTGLNTRMKTQVRGPQIQSRAQYRQTEHAREPPIGRKLSVPDVPLADDSAVDLPGISDGDESFNLNSEDDAFLAAVDLGEGDLGRPIDFEEGLGGGASMLNDSMMGGEEEEIRPNGAVQSPVAQPAPAHLHGRASNGSTSGASSDVNRTVRRDVNARSGLQTNARPSTSKVYHQIPQSGNGQANSTSTSSPSAPSLSVSSAAGPSAQGGKRPGGMSMGGFNFPHEMVSNTSIWDGHFVIYSERVSETANATAPTQACSAITGSKDGGQ